MEEQSSNRGWARNPTRKRTISDGRTQQTKEIHRGRHQAPGRLASRAPCSPRKAHPPRRDREGFACTGQTRTRGAFRADTGELGEEVTPAALAKLRALPMLDALAFWDGMTAHGKATQTLPAVVRELCLSDLFYLLVRACQREDMLKPWIYARCREVESSPNGHLDLWAREHYKTSIISFGLTIQDILRDPEVTFGIFSHTRPIAKAFLRQIMRELESNKVLHATFPDILWGEDIKQSPKWSEDDGIIVRRKGNPNEATVEAWGLVDGQPTSKHFRCLLYDDIVVQASVTTPEMIAKTMTALEQSYNVGTVDGARRFAGTRWHFNDAYRTIVSRGTVAAREHPGREGGTEDGKSVF